MTEPLPRAFEHCETIAGVAADALALELMLSSLPCLSRSSLELLAQRVVDRLDDLDGDADEEQDDFGGGNVEDERQLEDGILHPVYGVDQTRPAWAPPGYDWVASHA